MRQVAKLLRVIGRANLIDFYNNTLSYGTIHGAKLPSLSEFLELTLKETPKDGASFDDNTDKFLEAEALKRLEERRRNGK